MNRLRRAERWHHKNRKKKEAKKRIKKWNFFNHQYIPTDREIGIYSTTPKTCSCPMCCNERRNKYIIFSLTEVDEFGIIHRLKQKKSISKKDRLTKQELISLESFNDQLKDI